MKAIGVKMVDIMPMSVSMALEHGYRVGNANPNDMGYEITYPDGYKSWCPKDVADASYFCLSPENDGTKILEQDVDNFIAAKRGNRIGHKTTLMSLLTIPDTNVMVLALVLMQIIIIEKLEKSLL